MKKIFISCFALLSLLSCENYLDVNEDQQNRPGFDNITPAQMFAGAVNGYVNLQTITYNDFGNKMAYAWGLNSGFTTTDPAYDYNFTSSSYTGNFESTALIADNFQDILDKAALFPDYSYHFGAAKVFKVMCMDYATALYGDVPYSKAFNSTILAPSYDDDKAIIPQLFAELDQARDYFNNPSANVIDFASEDIVFGGDTAQWIQFINTIELKMLMRLSKTTDASLVALRTSRFANLPLDFISSDVAVNPGYNSSAVGQRTPIFRTYGLNEGFTDWTSSNRANAAGDYIAKLLNGQVSGVSNTATSVVDPRRSRLFTLVGGQITGNVQGIFPSAAISRVAAFFHGYTGLSAADAVNNGCSRDAYLMLASESEFLQAEAMQRGYMSGSAQAKFNDGIAASFAFYSRNWGLLPAGWYTTLNPTTYIAAIDTKNGLGWTASTNKISAIMTQKYLALANWHGIELHLDNLRTGFPVLPMPNGVSQTSRPFRLIYPSSEYSSNSSNVPNVTNAELFTVNSKTPYYLQ
jgi:hypothetical protein